ncbi:hypothetical protein ACWFRJ_41730, partial [Streptomyces sp. NPDC055239]
MKWPMRWLSRSAVQDTILVAALIVLSVFLVVWDGSRVEGVPGWGPWVGFVVQVVVLLGLLVRR